LTKEQIKLYTVLTKYEKSDCQAHWDYLACNYEGLYEKMGYPDPERVAKMVYKLTKKYK
jgi:predicted TPR repeat methyltransferase